MTQEQIEFINSFTNYNLFTFTQIKKERFNNEWTEECQRLFLETKMGIIHIAENFLLRPVRTFNALRLTFTQENEPIRNEITDSIIGIFDNWRQNN